MAADAPNTGSPQNAPQSDDLLDHLNALQASMSTIPGLLLSIHEEITEDNRLSERGQNLLEVADYAIRSLLRDLTVDIDNANRERWARRDG